jgi:hypothetical protein
MSQYDKGKSFKDTRALKSFLTRRKRVMPIRLKMRCEGGPFHRGHIFMSPYLSATLPFVVDGERGFYQLSSTVAEWRKL